MSPAVAFLLSLLIFGIKATFAGNPILTITKDNFNETLRENPLLLVEFYAPWCEHCKNLDSAYLKTARILNETDPEIKLGMVNAETEKYLEELYSIKRFPSLKLFKNGKYVTEYSGKRDPESVINWLRKKSVFSVVSLYSIEEINRFRADSDISAIGYFDIWSDYAVTFSEAAEQIDDVDFGLSASLSDCKEPGMSDTVVLFKKTEDLEVVYDGEITVPDLAKFFWTYSMPLIVEYEYSDHKIFTEYIQTLLLVLLKKSDEVSYSNSIRRIEPAARFFRGHVIFVVVDVTDPNNDRFLNVIGLSKNCDETLRIFRTGVGSLKFKPETDDITEENVRNFLIDYFSRKLKPHYRSEPVPEDWNKGPVLELVGSNFVEVVYDATTDVLVSFYLPWCEPCQALTPILEALGDRYKARTSVKIAKFDYTVNEVSGITIVKFPAIILYKQTSNEAVEFKGGISLKTLVEFLEKNSGSLKERKGDTEFQG